LFFGLLAGYALFLVAVVALVLLIGVLIVGSEKMRHFSLRSWLEIIVLASIVFLAVRFIH